MKGREKSEEGVSLLELLLAITVFVISVASISYLFIGSQTATDYSISKMQAVLLAKEKIEEKRELRDIYGFDIFIEGESVETDTISFDDRNYESVLTTNCTGDVCKFESVISWTSFGREEEVSFTEHLTGWAEVEQPEEEENGEEE